MRAHGHERLRVDGEHLNALWDCFPDTQSWMKRLRGRGVNTVRDFMRDLEYRAPVELLSMYACLFSDKAIAKLSAPAVEQLLKQRISTKDLAGVEYCPAIYLQKCELAQR